jgi:type VI secretion system protein ImpH
METPIRSAEAFIINSEQYDFFQYLSILERKGLLKNIKLVPSPKLGFPAVEIQHISDNPTQLEINWMGLYGVDSPLPHYILYKASKNDDEGKTLRAFLDIFNDRLYQLYYSALKKYQPAINSSAYHKYLSAVSESRIKSRVGLKALLKEYFRDLHVEVKSFIPTWRNIEIKEKYILGENILLGNKLLDLSSKIKIEIGPILFERALALKNNKDLIKLIQSYCPSYLDYKIYFLINVAKNTSCHLGQPHLILGWMCWSGEFLASQMQIML